MNKTLKLIRKIQVRVDLPTAEERREAIGKLYHWQSCWYRTANLMVSHLYPQEMISDFFYLTEGLRLKLWNEKKDPDGVLNTSRINTLYQVASKRFKGGMPTNIITCLKGAFTVSLCDTGKTTALANARSPTSERICPFLLVGTKSANLPKNPRRKLLDSFCLAYHSIPTLVEIAVTSTISYTAMRKGISNSVPRNYSSKKTRSIGSRYLNLKKKRMPSTRRSSQKPPSR